MSAPAPKNGFDLQAWGRTMVGVAFTIISAWQLFAKDIHGYIDEVSKREQERLSNTMYGYMLILKDSMNADAAVRDRAVYVRMDRMDSTHLVLQQQNAAILRQLDRLLDTGYAPN